MKDMNEREEEAAKLIAKNRALFGTLRRVVEGLDYLALADEFGKNSPEVKQYLLKHPSAKDNLRYTISLIDEHLEAKGIDPSLSELVIPKELLDKEFNSAHRKLRELYERVLVYIVRSSPLNDSN